MKKVILAIFISAFSSPLIAQDFTAAVKAKDSTYGYSVLNPLRLKKGNEKKSLEHSYQFLQALRTEDNQTLQLVQHLSVVTLENKQAGSVHRNKVTGNPLGGKSGSIDKYIFVTSVSKDTILLYVDIYDEGTMEVPVRLKIATAQ